MITVTGYFVREKKRKVIQRIFFDVSSVNEEAVGDLTRAKIAKLRSLETRYDKAEFEVYEQSFDSLATLHSLYPEFNVLTAE